MTRRETGLFVLVLIAAALLVVVWLGARLRAARDELAAARAAAAATRARVAEAYDLHRRAHALERGPREDDALIARVREALGDAGLSYGVFAGVTQRRDREIPGSQVRVQSVIVRLEGLDMGEFGSWLAAWREHDSPWRLIEVQLTHRRESGGGANRGAMRVRASAGQPGGAYDTACIFAAPFWEEEP
ncbi:MAG: hypothetical protein ACLFP0_07870 [Rhodosalinus sp.]